MVKSREMRRLARVPGAATAMPLLVLLTFAPVLHAQSDVDRENAQALYKAGNDARDAGDAKTAASRYKAAYALVQTPVIAVALGKTELALGQLIEARQSFLGVERIPAKPSESVLTTSARAEAAALAAQIEPRIPAVTLKILGPQGAPAPTVTIDGVTIPEAALDAPRRVNAGEHVAVATNGGARTERKFSIAEAATEQIVLDYPAPPSTPPALRLTEPAAKPARNVPPPGPSDQGPPASGQTSSAAPARVPAYVALAIGGVGAAATAVFGGLALGNKASLDSACGMYKTECPSSSQSDISAMHTNSIVSDVGLAVGVVGFGVGAVLLLVNRRSGSGTAPPDGASAISLEPWVGAGALGMRGGF